MSVKLAIDRSRLGIALLIVACINPVASIMGFLMSSVLVFRSSEGRVLAVFLIWFSTTINEGISIFAGSSLRYVILLMVFAIAMSAAIRRGQISLLAVVTLLLALAIAAHSISFSLVPDVSIFKIIIWTGGVMGMILNWEGMSAGQRNHAVNLITVGLTFVMILSLPLAFFPIGYFTNGKGFQGLLNQPQNFGVAMALLAAIRGAKIMDRSDATLSNIVLFLLAILCMFASQARVAALAGGGSLGLAVVFFAITGNLRQLSGLTSRWVAAICIISLISVAFAAEELLSEVDEFINKGGRDGAAGLPELFMASRGVLILPMLSNISSNLMTGIGFGIGSNPDYMQIVRDPVFGLPISAPIEKGVMPIAVVEELGLPLAIGVLLWVLFLLARSRSLGIVAFSAVCCFVLINLAENAMFSVGGPGLLGLLLMTGFVTRGNGSS